VDSFVAGINMAIFKNTKNLSGAMKFVKFMTSTSEQQILNKTYGSMPSVTAAYNDPAFETPHMKVFEQVLQNSATPLPEVPQESQFETVVGTAMKTLFADAATGKPVTDALIMSQLQAADQQLAAGG
jgi:multiple sugar transport system substrate-binding protein